MKLTYNYLFATTFLLFSTHLGYSQELKIGDKVPDYVFRNVWNYSKQELRFSEFKDKLIILDFWSFWCIPCIKKLPEIDSLQREYQEKVQFIMVNLKPIEQTIDFFDKRKRIKVPSNTPFIADDGVLDKAFPHNGVPFYVWIENGRVVYITHMTVNNENLNRHLGGETRLFNVPAKTIYTNSIHQPEIFPYVKYGSHIIKGIDTLNFHIDQPGSNLSYNAHCVEELYQYAYNESDTDGFYKFREYGRTILDVEEKEIYGYPERGGDYDLWRGKYGYYYYSILPDHLQDRKYEIMKEDLNRFFGLKVSIEIRPVKCLTIVRTSRRDKLRTKGGNPDYTLFGINYKTFDYEKTNPPIRFLRNQPFQHLVDLIQNLGNTYWRIKVVDHTDYKGNIDFEMSEREILNDNLEDYRKALNRYDLDIVEKMVPMEVLVIRK